MDEKKMAMLQELELEDSRVLRNGILACRLKQPLAWMLNETTWSCRVTNDGSEVFANGEVEITVPPSCVRWLKEPEKPDGPTEMPKDRCMLMQMLRNEK